MRAQEARRHFSLLPFYPKPAFPDTWAGLFGCRGRRELACRQIERFRVILVTVLQRRHHDFPREIQLARKLLVPLPS